MSSSACTFSLPLDTQQRLETIIRNADTNGLRALVMPNQPAPSRSSPRDVNHLHPQDYAQLYQLLGVAHRPEDLNNLDFQRALNRVNGERAVAAHRMFIQLRLTGKAAERAERRAARPVRGGRLTASSAVNALIILGMETLRERCEDHRGSQESNAGGSTKKSARTRARKNIAA